jgi:hypothetical protein
MNPYNPQREVAVSQTRYLHFPSVFAAHRDSFQGC